MLPHQTKTEAGKRKVATTAENIAGVTLTNCGGVAPSLSIFDLMVDGVPSIPMLQFQLTSSEADTGQEIVDTAFESLVFLR
jgi:hypothetical protein